MIEQGRSAAKQYKIYKSDVKQWPIRLLQVPEIFRTRDIWYQRYFVSEIFRTRDISYQRYFVPEIFCIRDIFLYPCRIIMQNIAIVMMIQLHVWAIIILPLITMCICIEWVLGNTTLIRVQLYMLYTCTYTNRSIHFNWKLMITAMTWQDNRSWNFILL